MTTEIKLYKLLPYILLQWQNYSAVLQFYLKNRTHTSLRKSLQVTNFFSYKVAYSEVMDDALLKYQVIPSVSRFQLQNLVNDLG
jgi:hypothetical protein